MEYLLLPILFLYKKISHFFLEALGLSYIYIYIYIYTKNIYIYIEIYIYDQVPLLDISRYFSFVKQKVLVVVPDYSFVTTKSPILFFIRQQMVGFEYFQSMISCLIFLNKFFLHLDADSTIVNGYIQWNSW